MVQPDEGRVDCPVADACGGCAWIGRSAHDQLRDKRARVVEAFSTRMELRGTPVEDCLPSPRPTGYRNRAKLAVEATGGAVRVGLFRTGTDEVVDLAPCRVQSAELLRHLAAIRGWLAERSLARPGGPVRHIDLRLAAAGRCHLTLVLTREIEPMPELDVATLFDRLPGLCGVAINGNPTGSSYVFGPLTRTLAGERTFLAELPSLDGGVLRFEVPATGFFQVATDLMPVVHGRMRRHLGPCRCLLDLYCGVGVHGLVVARGRSVEVVGFESSRAACSCARRNAHRHGVDAVYHAGPAEKELVHRLASEPLEGGVILNPGRAGCRAGLLDAIAGRARRIAYLSCDPDSLARDLAVLVRAGQGIRQVQPLDVMPQTDHVETLVLLASSI